MISDNTVVPFINMQRHFDTWNVLWVGGECSHSSSQGHSWQEQDPPDPDYLSWMKGHRVSSAALMLEKFILFDLGVGMLT